MNLLLEIITILLHLVMKVIIMPMKICLSIYDKNWLLIEEINVSEKCEIDIGIVYHYKTIKFS